MLITVAVLLIIVAAVVSVVELYRTAWKSLPAWGLLVLAISLLAERYG